MNKPHLLTLRLGTLLLALCATGCTAFEKGTPQDVIVLSYPDGANVSIDGLPAGETPMLAEMHRKTSYKLVASKDGYKPQTEIVGPVPNEASRNFIRFGLLSEVGFYYDLKPNPVEFKLVPSLVPDYAGADPYGEMVERVLQADKMREQGKLSADEHRYVVHQIVEFYSNQ